VTSVKNTRPSFSAKNVLKLTANNTRKVSWKDIIFPPKMIEKIGAKNTASVEQ